MEQVPVRQLNQHTAAVLQRVEAGERIQITRRGQVIAILEPIAPSPLADLVDAGELRPALGRLPAVTAADGVASDSAGADAVSNDRDGGRW